MHVRSAYLRYAPDLPPITTKQQLKTHVCVRRNNEKMHVSIVSIVSLIAHIWSMHECK